MFALDYALMQQSSVRRNTPPGPQPTPDVKNISPLAPAKPSTFAPGSTPLPESSGIPPATVQFPALAKQFKVSDQQAFLTQYDDLTLAMRRLHGQQPSFSQLKQQQVASMLADQPYLDPANLIVKRWTKQSDGSIKTLSEEPLLKVLERRVAEQLGTPAKKDDSNVCVGVFTQRTDTRPSTEITPLHSLHTIAERIATQYPAILKGYWTKPRPTERNPQVLAAPQSQLLDLHKQQLSTLAALRASDGTLSAASKKLIDNALQHPTLAEREKNFPDGARPGVYPLMIDDGTERGALMAGTFLITQTDGSFATPPAWPQGKSLALNDAHGPVVLYTPGEGFEAFATPAQARQALAKRLDEGGANADLLLQTLPLSLQNRAEPPSGEDLMLIAAPLDGDVLAEGIPWMLARQQAEIEASQCEDPLSSTTIDAAADWSYLLDGSNALLARNQALADKLQPEWLKKLSPAQEALFTHLEHAQEKSANALTPLIQSIPSLATFARDRMNEAIKKSYPNAVLDADQLMVQVRTKTYVNNGRKTNSSTPYEKNTQVSLTDLALKNPTEFPAGEAGTFTQITFKLPLTDKQGKPLLDTDGKPIVLDTDQLKTLVNTADVGGEYTALLKKELVTDDAAGLAGKRRNAWKASQADLMGKEAFLATLNPDAYKAEAKDDKTSKRGAQWVDAVLDHPDPATRPQVDGETVVSHALVQRGLPVQGVMVIGNTKDAERVLYAPNAPDGLTFREVASQEALNTLLDKNEWKLYTASRKSPVSKDDVAKAEEALKKHTFNLGGNPASAIDNYVKALNLKGETSTLTPMTGNGLDALYKQHVQLVIDKADHQSVSSAEVKAQSTANKILFGVEVAMIFMDLLPVVGKGASMGLRLGKAGVAALRANARLLPKLVKNPALGRAIYADFATAGAGIPVIRTAPLRPVGKAPLRAIEHIAKASQKNGPPQMAASSSNRIAAQDIPTSNVITTAGRDLSAFTVPSTVIQGRPLRPDGTYNVGGNFYVRFTDSTEVNQVYQIDSAFHARSGQVNIIDPNAPLTTPKSGRIKASLQSAGGGEWRLNVMAGGRRGAQRRQSPTPPVEYVDYLFAGGADFTAVSGSRGTARRWFRNDMENFYQRQANGALPPRPNMLASPANTSPGDLMRIQLENGPGLVLGEQHNQVAMDVLLIENMPMFREMGVTTLLLEGAPGIGLTPYVAADIPMIPLRPRNAAYQNNTPSRMALYEAAEKNGIKIVGIEHEHLTQHTTRSATNDSLNLRHTNDRQRELNYYATKVIGQVPPGEKWVAVVGRSHMNTSRGVPGIAELTGVPGIGVYDGARGSASVTRPTTGPRPDRQQRLGVNDVAGDYQIYQNVDEYLKPISPP